MKTLIFITFFLGFYALPLEASVIEGVETARCSVTFEFVASSTYTVVSVESRGINLQSACEDEFSRLSGLTMGSTTDLSAIAFETLPTTKFSVPFTSFSSMGQNGAIVGIHYYFEALTVLPDELIETTTTENQTVSLWQTRIMDLLSNLFGWMY